MSMSNTPHSPETADQRPEGASQGAEKTAQPPSVREAAQALAAEVRKAVMAEPGSAHDLVNALEVVDAALAEPEVSRADLLPDAPWAIEGIEFMREGKPIIPKHIHAIINAAEAGLQAHGSFELRWRADMRAIERWRRGDELPQITRQLLGAAKEEIESAASHYADHPDGMGQAYRDCSKLVAAIEEHLVEAAPGGRELIMPDHADLVVWLLGLVDADPSIDISSGELEELISKIGRAGLWHASQGSMHGHSIDGGHVAGIMRSMWNALYAAERRCLRAEVAQVEACRMLREAGERFRFYEQQHRDKAERWQADQARAAIERTPAPSNEQIEETIAKAEANAEIAQRIEELAARLAQPQSDENKSV